jgi:hypothetical protein
MKLTIIIDVDCQEQKDGPDFAEYLEFMIASFTRGLCESPYGVTKCEFDILSVYNPDKA